jgi:hypothetical protein
MWFFGEGSIVVKEDRRQEKIQPVLRCGNSYPTPSAVPRALDFTKSSIAAKAACSASSRPPLIRDDLKKSSSAYFLSAQFLWN